MDRRRPLILATGFANHEAAITAEVYRGTEASRLRYDLLVERIANYDGDKSRKLRQEVRECKACFYLHGARIAGQAFTHANCRICDGEMVFSSTDVTAICPECSDDHHACRRCIGDIDMVLPVVRKGKLLKRGK